MNPQSYTNTDDRIILGRPRNARRTVRHSPSGSYVLTIAGGLLGSTVLLWAMVQLGQASGDSKATKIAPPMSAAARQATAEAAEAGVPVTDAEESEQSLLPPAKATQGPAIDVPREIIEMLDLRKRDLDRREDSIRQKEERLMMVRSDIEQLLAKNEALEKRIQAARAQQTPQENDVNAQREKGIQDRERQAQEHKMQLAKMYESMPPEEAAARLERMPDRKAVEILRLVKSKTAGNILAQVKVDRAARLTEEMLVHNP